MPTHGHDEWVAQTFGVHPESYGKPEGAAATPRGATARPGPTGPVPGPTGAAQPARPAFAPPPQSRQPTLRPGDQSADGWVEYMQELLKITVTGVYDPATQKAVRAFQAAHGCQVDGVVGNETWSVLRHETKEKIGTDGRAPHNFEQKGLAARFFTEEKWVIYDKAQDSVAFSIASVGDSDEMAAHTATFRITPPGGKGQVIERPIGPATWTSPDKQGNRHTITLSGLKATYPAEAGAQGLYHIEAYLDADLGGDRWSGDVRDDAPKEPPVHGPASKPAGHTGAGSTGAGPTGSGPTSAGPTGSGATGAASTTDPVITDIERLIEIVVGMQNECHAIQDAIQACSDSVKWTCKVETLNAGGALAAAIIEIKKLIASLSGLAYGMRSAGKLDADTVRGAGTATFGVMTVTTHGMDMTRIMITCMQSATEDDEETMSVVRAMDINLNNILSQTTVARRQVRLIENSLRPDPMA